MAVTPAFCPLSLQSVLDQNGIPQIGALVTLFDAGTTSLRPGYADRGLTQALTSPILTDAFGRIPTIWVGAGDYKIVIADPSGAQIVTVDNLAGGVVPPATPSAGTVLPTGSLLQTHGSDVVDGWLPANGKTIGSGNSSGAARANDDTQALFTYLWNNDSTLAVSGNRGSSASNDFAAAKTIALPDYRGRTFVGRSAMGSTESGVLPTIANADQAGATFGADKITLSSDQMPSHTHGVSVGAAGGHTPTGVTDIQGSHTHTGSTDQQGAHNHNATYNFASASGAGGRAPQPYDSSSQNVINTDTQGAHYHGLTINAGGAHQHTAQMAPVPDHTHPVTQNAVGGGGAHSNLQPSILGTWHIKL